ncbi:DUF1315 family protein [Psychrobacter sp. HD31]|uniref:YeaC family protein n=1 Tax=Psychrobacter sp. HD31 TaxID=3112003 RepID=UPI003DA1EDC8
MDKQVILESLTPEIVEKFRTAIEIGKWADGRKLTSEQLQTCMQAVMVWEHEHLAVEERTGFINKPVKKDGTVVGEACDVEHEHHYPNNPNPTVKPVNFKNK